MGESGSSIDSTIVDCTKEEVKILRAGAISENKIRKE